MYYGQVAQAYDYGAFIWDLENERGFPVYYEDMEVGLDLRHGDLVSFKLNEEKTAISDLARIHASDLPDGTHPQFEIEVPA